MVAKIGNVTESDIMEANFTLNDNYAVIMGDERFYRLMGDKTLYTFNMLIHPDDREHFERFMCMENTEESAVVRCIVGNNTYRWFLLNKKNVTDAPNNKAIINLHMQDVFVISSKFDLYFKRVRKYRAVMNMIREKVFEYDNRTGMLTIYCYINNRSEIIEKDSLEEWQKRVKRLGFVEETQEELLDRLCDNIKSGAESFSITFRSAIMSKGERNDLLNFKGQTVFDGNERVITIGLISELGSRMANNNILLETSDANLDSATGVLNKKAITDEVTSAINLANTVGNGQTMYIMVWDIDDFKQVNDTYGHYFGDEVIKCFARELNRSVGSRGIVGRIGGDEFLVLLKETEGIESLRILLKSIRNKLKMELAQKKEGYEFSTSIGISEYGKDGKDYEKLFKIADGALYIAKEKGKDRYIIYDKEKHGDLLNDDFSNRKKVAGVDFMRQIDKMELASDLMIKVLCGGRDSVKEVLSELMDKMNIHGITVFEGSDMKCVAVRGHYEMEPEAAGYLYEGEYLKKFDEHHIHVINNVASVAVDYPAVYEKFKRNNICSSLQFLSYFNGELVAMLEFDIFGDNRRKWSQDDISTIYIVVKAITDVFRKIREE